MLLYICIINGSHQEFYCNREGIRSDDTDIRNSVALIPYQAAPVNSISQLLKLSSFSKLGTILYR